MIIYERGSFQIRKLKHLYIFQDNDAGYFEAYEKERDCLIAAISYLMEIIEEREE